MYLTDNFEMCINGDGIFSHSLLLIPLPPNIGGKWIKYTPLGVIVAFNCVEAAICPFFLSVPKQPVRCGDRAEMHKSSYPGSPKLQGLAVSKGLFSTPCLLEDRAEMQKGHLMSYPSGLSFTVQRYWAMFLPCWLQFAENLC